ncbi:ABC transporter ATP-binding protein [Paenochrobactrum glaciei]|uniref:ABC transporter ATP-binding protein n=1 Tax=Paenochrobactrum glaciei TaxID=486407 RepID=A0ABN1G5L7_9HYPH
MLLQIDQLETFYGASQALFGVDLSIAKGEVLALMGRNGMGKTTTISSVFGLNPAKRGKVVFNGTDITKQKPYKIARLGLGLVPEGRRCFPNLTVNENLLASARHGEWTIETVRKLFPRLEERGQQSAQTLSGGEQQMLAVGRALMTNPELIVLDEATEGLAPVIRQEIWKAIRALKNTGQSIIVVDKTLSELLPVADQCVILEKGVTVWRGTPDHLDADVQERYLGV